MPFISGQPVKLKQQNSRRANDMALACNRMTCTSGNTHFEWIVEIQMNGNRNESEIETPAPGTFRCFISLARYQRCLSAIRGFLNSLQFMWSECARGRTPPSQQRNIAQVMQILLNCSVSSAIRQRAKHCFTSLANVDYVFFFEFLDVFLWLLLHVSWMQLFVCFRRISKAIIMWAQNIYSVRTKRQYSVRMLAFKWEKSLFFIIFTIFVVSVAQMVIHHAFWSRVRYGPVPLYVY